MKTNIKLLIFLISCSGAVAWADICPPPSSSIDPSVQASVKFNKKTGTYTYKYELQSGVASLIGIDFLAIQIDQAPTGAEAPVHWLSDLNKSAIMPTHFEWFSSGRSTDLQPGQHLSGFSFQSMQSPGLVVFNAEGETGVPSSSPPPEGSPDDQPEPNCPDWDFNSPRFKTLVTGITTGPLAPNTVSVKMRLREETGRNRHAPIDPKNPTGKVSALILASRAFDPSQIDLSSIKFGPNDVSPLSSKLVPARDDDDRDDEREEWERHTLGLDDEREHEHDKDPKKQNLFLVFDLASLGVKCVLDKAIILTGRTQAGVKIIGGVGTRLVGCDVRHPGKRDKKPDPKEIAAKLKIQHRFDRAKGIH